MNPSDIWYEQKLNGDCDVYAIDAVRLCWYNAGTVRQIDRVWYIVWPDGTLSNRTYPKRNQAAQALVELARQEAA